MKRYGITEVTGGVDDGRVPPLAHGVRRHVQVDGCS
jgi:hypothetical protein